MDNPTPTALEILSKRGMKTKLARHLGESPYNIYSILQNGNPTIDTKVKWAKAINEMFGSEFTFFELFPVTPTKENNE